MAETKWGANVEEWETLAKLDPEHTWSCVCDPKIHGVNGQDSSLSKRPSAIDRRTNLAYGMKGFTTQTTSPGQRAEWQAQEELGFGVVGVNLHGIDIDIDDEEVASEIQTLFEDRLGVKFQPRTRPGVGRRMLLWRPVEPKNMAKTIVETEHGAVEFLYNKNFMVLAGRHKSGYRYQYPKGMPQTYTDLPEVDYSKMEEVISELQETYGTNITRAASTELDKPRDIADANQEEVDKMIEVLKEHDLYRGTSPEGRIDIHCPWHEQHESTGGEKDAIAGKTSLFPPGVGGRTEWGFRCLHDAGHGYKTFQQFQEKINLLMDEYPIAPEVVNPPPDLIRSPKGVVLSKDVNILLLLRWEGFPFDVKFDEYLGTVIVRNRNIGDSSFRPLRDSDRMELSILLQTQFDFPNVSLPRLTESINLAAEYNRCDSGIEWAESLRWDGVERLKDFHTRVLNTADTEYNQAVVYYMFTALAGRLIQPGIKADMMPVLYGKQGPGKTKFLSTLAPEGLPGSFAAASFNDKGDDIIRKTLGTSVVEISELDGMDTANLDQIKAWITREEDKWVKKYAEATHVHKRRFIPFGTANQRNFISDITGARRWLPIEILSDGAPVVDRVIDIEYVEKYNHQLWAEAVVMFKKYGVMWRKAQMLGIEVTQTYLGLPLAMTQVLRWHDSGNSADGMSTLEVLQVSLAMNLSSPRVEKISKQVEQVLTHLGYYHDANTGVWRSSLF